MRPAAVLLLAIAGTAPLRAQDTLRLRNLQDAAVARDPRVAQFALEEQRIRLRLADISSERLPQLRLNAEASHESEVTNIPVNIEGIQIPQMLKDHYQALLNVDQIFYDGGALAHRGAVERAQSAEREAQLRSTLYGLRQQVNDAFFTVLLLQQQLAENASLANDLESQLRLVRAQFDAGASLAGDTAAVVVKLLEAEEQRSELDASRRAAVGVLEKLTGRMIGHESVLAPPELAAEVRSARSAAAAPQLRARPEYAQFERTRETLERQSLLLGTERRPQLDAYFQVAYARPGLNQYATTWGGYWIGGLRLQWQPWRWGTIARQEEALDVERRIVVTNEAAFSEQLDRQVESDLATIERLGPALARDERMVALRAEIEREARAQLAERTITAAQYVERRTDLAEARVGRARRQIELAQAEAHYLTTLGLELR